MPRQIRQRDVDLALRRGRELSVAMTVPRTVIVTVPTGALPSSASTRPVTFTGVPAFTSALFGTVKTAVSTSSTSTRTATERGAR